MAHAFYEEHRDTLDEAVDAIAERSYWSPYPESPRAFGEQAPSEGEAAFLARLNSPFELMQPFDDYVEVAESSPYGTDLGVSYPASDSGRLLAAADNSAAEWSGLSPRSRAAICIEILDRLSARSFEMAYAVMHTTGQPFLMAFQAGGPHALDRGLEAVAYGYAEMNRIPRTQRWVKPQGKRDPLVLDKRWRIKPRGVAVAIGVSTFPTWNGYPGIFASLVTGNPVIVKPHPMTILPLALFVETAQRVISDAGLSPHVVTLAVDTPENPIAQQLVMDPRVGIVDYTGGSVFGDWLETNARHAEVYTEKSGVNSVIIDSADDLKGIYRNLSVSMSMYSGQMCTTPQNVYVPADGIDVAGERVSFTDIASGLAGAVQSLLADDDRAADILGAIKNPESLERIDAATADGEVLLEPRTVVHPSFPEARLRTPTVLIVDSTDKDSFMQELFGPIIVIVATRDTEESLKLATESALAHGAITWLAYTTSEAVMDRAEDAAVDAGVSLAFNLTGGLFVNQSAAFSDFHVTGANPAGNASLSDPAFVAKRFRIVGIRTPA